jgi:carboxypeptidase C (cathepsin A)
MKQNPYSWNKRANLVYIESPAGVGYSIANATGDGIHNDYS